MKMEVVCIGRSSGEELGKERLRVVKMTRWGTENTEKSFLAREIAAGAIKIYGAFKVGVETAATGKHGLCVTVTQRHWQWKVVPRYCTLAGEYLVLSMYLGTYVPMYLEALRKQVHEYFFHITLYT